MHGRPGRSAAGITFIYLRREDRSPPHGGRRGIISATNHKMRQEVIVADPGDSVGGTHENPENGQKPQKRPKKTPPKIPPKRGFHSVVVPLRGRRTIYTSPLRCFNMSL